MNAPSEPGSAPAAPSMRAGSYTQTELTASPNTASEHSRITGRAFLVSAITGAVLAGSALWLVDANLYTVDDQNEGAAIRKAAGFDELRDNGASYGACTAIARALYWVGPDPQTFHPAADAFWEGCTGVPTEVAY